MAKKVNGYMINHGGWIEFDQAPDDNGPWVPCTMIVSDKAHERVFTESEVRAIMEEVRLAVQRFYSSGVDRVNNPQPIEVVARAHGIVIDPA